MATRVSHRGSDQPSAGVFATTHWSMIVAAGRSSSPRSRKALAELCETYWPPLYAYLRRSGYKANEAEEHTQGFFAHLLSQRDLGRPDRERGKFRSFLLTCLKHFVLNTHRQCAAQKRGGGKLLSLDFQSAENRYAMEPAHDVTPERIFERRWAMTVLDRATQLLRAEFTEAGKAKHFELLSPHLAASQERGPLAEVAAALEMTDGALRTALTRMRQRFRQLLREEVGRTVEDPALVDEEIRQLMSAVGT